MYRLDVPKCCFYLESQENCSPKHNKMKNFQQCLIKKKKKAKKHKTLISAEPFFNIWNSWGLCHLHFHRHSQGKMMSLVYAIVGSRCQIINLRYINEFPKRSCDFSVLRCYYLDTNLYYLIDILICNAFVYIYAFIRKVDNLTFVSVCK